jgi:hypothetical protein
MAAPNQAWSTNVRDDDWLPPPWNEPAPKPKQERVPRLSAPPVHVARGPVRAPAPPAQPKVALDPRARHVFAIAVPQAIIGLVALAASLSSFLEDRGGSAPVSVLLVMGVCLAGQAVARFEEPRALRTAWLVGLATTVLALPTGAIQVTLARQPYAGTQFGSAGALLAATVAFGLILVLTALTLAIVCREAPEEAALLFMGMALLVPAIIGVRSSLSEMSTVRALAESSLIAAVASVIAWSIPRSSRPMIAPASLAVQFILLWMMGKGPSFYTSHGDIVPLTQGALLTLTVLLVVGVPVLAMWSRRLFDGPNSGAVFPNRQ